MTQSLDQFLLPVPSQPFPQDLPLNCFFIATSSFQQLPSYLTQQLRPPSNLHPNNYCRNPNLSSFRDLSGAKKLSPRSTRSREGFCYIQQLVPAILLHDNTSPPSNSNLQLWPLFGYRNPRFCVSVRKIEPRNKEFRPPNFS